MKLKVAQIVGLNTDQKAAQVFSSQREQESFFAVLQLTCDDAFTKGRLILSELADLYFDFEGTPAEKLNNTFSQSLKKFESIDSFDLLLGSISGKVLYLIGQGEVEVYLKRLNKLSSLLSSHKQIISGFLQPNDRILLATLSLITFLGSDLDKSLSLSLDTFEEEISSQTQSSLAGLAIEIESEGQEEAMEEEKSISTFTKKVSTFTKKVSTFFITKFYFPKSGRSRLILAIILVIIIAAGVGLQYKNSRDKERMLQFNQNLQAAKDDFAQAKGLSSLNPIEAKTKLDGALTKITLALSSYPNSKEAQDLKKSIEQESGSILQQFEVPEFPLFLDLDLIKKDFKAESFTLSASKLLLLDPTTKTLVSLDLTKKSHQILSGKEELGDAKYASINGSLAFVYSQDKGIVRIDTQNQKVTEVAEKDPDWSQIQDIAGFAGNVYILDAPPAGGQVWKYLPTSSGYSAKREYLTKDTKESFTDALRMQIESSIYVLKQGGEILRFTKGAKDHFSYAGLDKGVKDPKSLFVSSDSENLYVLDSGNSRLLILTKTGEYKGQITGNKFGLATDLVVDEKGKKVYLLEGSKIYSVDLK